jgi:hypothetical protein
MGYKASVQKDKWIKTGSLLALRLGLPFLWYGWSRECSLMIFPTFFSLVIHLKSQSSHSTNPLVECEWYARASFSSGAVEVSVYDARYCQLLLSHRILVKRWAFSSDLCINRNAGKASSRPRVPSSLKPVSYFL